MLKIKDGFVMRNVFDEWIIVPVGQREKNDTYIMSVNETGCLLWKLLEKGTTEDELVNAILAEYDVDVETAKTDVTEFVQVLINKKII